MKWSFDPPKGSRAQIKNCCLEEREGGNDIIIISKNKYFFKKELKKRAEHSKRKAGKVLKFCLLSVFLNLSNRLTAFCLDSGPIGM